jgi:hypothetical protein
MSDEGEFWRDVREHHRKQRAEHGIPCPVCVEKLPKADPTILLPGQRCRIHGYRDSRPRQDSEK